MHSMTYNIIALFWFYTSKILFLSDCETYKVGLIFMPLNVLSCPFDVVEFQICSLPAVRRENRTEHNVEI